MFVQAKLPKDLEEAVSQRQDEVTFGQNYLGSDIDREALSGDTFWIIAKTALGAVITTDQTKKETKVLILPLREFRKRHQCPREGAIPSLWWMATRMRNYVAYFCSSPIPVAFRFLGKTLVVPRAPQRDSLNDIPASLMGDYLSQRVSYDELGKKLEGMYDRAEKYLSSVKADSLLDRAIIHAGDAYWARDPSDRFLQSWKAIEAIADMDFHQARKAHEESLEETMSEYLDPGMLNRVRITSAKVVKLNRIKAMVKRRVPGLSSKSLDGLASLRNSIAHGEVTAEKFRAIIDRDSEAMNVARTAIESTLHDFDAANRPDS